MAIALAQPAWADIGRIKLASGTASIERDGKLLLLKPGFVIETGDTLVTGARGKAEEQHGSLQERAAGRTGHV